MALATRTRGSLVAIGSAGEGPSWGGQLNNVVRIFNEFVKHNDEATDSPRIGNDFQDLDEKRGLCDRSLYERFAHYLVHVYVKPAGTRGEGDHLGCDTAINYLNSILEQANEKCGSNERSRAFFACRDKTVQSENRRWLVGVRDNMFKLIFKRAAKSGEELDNSAAPLYMSHVKSVCRAYALTSTAEAAMRKLAVKALWQVAGRSGEVAFLTWARLTWDSHFRCIVPQIPQVKSAKLKKAVFAAGVDRHSCAFLDLADMLVLVSRPVFTEDFPAWLFPELQRVGNPGTTLGTYIKCLVPPERQGDKPIKSYTDVAVHEQPEGACAAGIRVGAANELFSSGMPDNFATTTTWHAMNEHNAFHEYIRATTANAMPGVVVLAGFTGSANMHTGTQTRGMGPKPADLDALGILVGDTSWDNILDELFRLDNSSPPKLLRGGELRPAVRAAFATLIMYYKERLEAREMEQVNIRLRDVIIRGGFAASAHDADETLHRWGRHLFVVWEKDNLHLFGKHTEVAFERVLHVITCMHDDVKLARQEAREANERAARAEEMLCRISTQLTRMEAQGAQREASRTSEPLPVVPPHVVPLLF